MIYKFKSKATGDVIMMGPQGDAVLRLLGREPSAQGIIEVADMPGALSALEKAVADDDAARRASGGDTGEADDDQDEADGAKADTVGLRQRVWPLVEAIKRAQAAGEPLVWGV